MIISRDLLEDITVKYGSLKSILMEQDKKISEISNIITESDTCFLFFDPIKSILYLTGKRCTETSPGNLSQLFNETFSKKTAKLLLSFIQKVLAAEELMSEDFQIRTRVQKRKTWINLQLKSKFGKNGKLKNIEGVLKNITNQKQKEERLKQHLKIADALLEVNHTMEAMENKDKFMEFILLKVASVIPNVDCASFLTLGDDNFFRIFASVGYDLESIKKFKLPYNELFFNKINASRYKQPVIVNNTHKIDGKVTPFAKPVKRIKIKSLINTPIFLRGKLISILSLDSRQNYIFDKEDLEVMKYVKTQIEMALGKFKGYEMVKFNARHDHLTGFISRNYFQELFEQNLKLAQRYTRILTLAVMDIDRLKLVNDSLGHLAGDTLLEEFAKALKDYFRESDIFSRFGGDEFTALFVSVESKGIRDKFFKLIKKLAARPVLFNGEKIICRFSFGLATYPEDGLTYTALFEEADKRMYTMKYNKKALLKKGEQIYKGKKIR